MYWILPVILAAVVLFLTFAYNQNNRPDITAYDLSAPGAPACTVVHLSDLHSKPSARILNETAAQKPDIICITGDYINDKNRNRQKMLDYSWCSWRRCCTFPAITSVGWRILIL